ncbi:MAG: GNAT family N-acetyltransferase [Chloroflexota bacterium]
MKNETVITEKFIAIPEAPEISGLSFRGFRGEGDFPKMLAVIHGSKDADGIERSDTLEDIVRNYEHLVNCDPYQDVLIAEMDGQVIGYSRVFWDRLDEGIRVYNHFGFLLPEWRRKGIGTAMLHHNERRLRQISADHLEDEPHFFQSWAVDTEKATHALLQNQGYEPARYSFDMVRDLNEPFPQAPVPTGLKIRPVEEEHIWPIFHASNEAFRDAWGYRPLTDLEYENWMADPNFRPELWKVAWDGNQIAGMVLNFYNPRENEEYDRLRGYTEGICVRRPWRKRGLARSLIVQSMKMFKEMGMTETALGVDAENTTGALNLYKGCGYKVIKQQTIYRKPMVR